uniref:CD9 antigen n=1 Tax=Culex pipiens TaxID=7175 RepID=A0A8D8G6S0_CULPI
MALHGCCGVIKYLVVLVNLLFWFVGFSIVLLAIWMLTDPSFLISMTQNESNYFIGLYILLVVGGLMLTVAFLGCCGAFKESRCMLLSFFSCLLIVLVAELAAGAWAYHNSSKLDTYVRSAVKNAVQDEYSVLPTRTATLDSIQKYGCMEKLVDGIKQNIKLVYIVGAGVIGVEILALIFALLLCCAIRRSSNYKN